MTEATVSVEWFVPDEDRAKWQDCVFYADYMESVAVVRDGSGREVFIDTAGEMKYRSTEDDMVVFRHGEDMRAEFASDAEFAAAEDAGRIDCEMGPWFTLWIDPDTASDDEFDLAHEHVCSTLDEAVEAAVEFLRELAS